MKLRNPSKSQPEASEPLEQDAFWIILGFIAGIALLIALPFLTYDLFVRDIYGPLLHGDPYVLVNYAYFAVPALLLGGTIVVALGILIKVKSWLGNWIEPSAPYVRWCVRGLYISLALMLLLPPVGGKITERYVRAEGYVYCSKLFELGVATYSRGYVKDPRVCVDPRALEAALERYGYHDAARRYRFEK